jgi:hypothetical protein
MLGQKVLSAGAKSLAALALAGAVTAGSAEPASAAMTNAYMACGEGTETVYFGLPLDSPARMSIFAFRVNGGAWQWTPWYYTAQGRFWLYNGSRWEPLPAEGSSSINIVGNNKLVEGWEYRVNVSTGAGSWVSLGSCRTTSFFGGGLVFN